MIALVTEEGIKQKNAETVPLYVACVVALDNEWQINGEQYPSDSYNELAHFFTNQQFW